MEEGRTAERYRMVREQVAGKGVADARVLAAMRKVERHRFIPPEVQEAAYDAGALPIGLSQTIPPAYVAGVMLEALRLETGRERVLDVGTGSGYQAALLAELSGLVI